MSWIASMLIAFLAGVVGLLAAGLVMSACVGWYHVSSFEGQSGYAIVGVALLGGIAGLVIGLVVSRLVPAEASLAFLKGLGAAWGVIVLLAGISAWIAYALADIPPTIDGQELMLEVEIRLPVDVKESPAESTEESWVELGSLSGRVQRRSRRGELHVADSRQEDGRWIVPGAIFLFTSRGERMLSLWIGGEPVQGFIVPLPARPKRQHLEWSEWGPQPPPPNPPWPDTKPSYRFRVRPIEPADPEPSQADLDAAEAAQAQARFEAMDPAAPVAEWILWTRYGVTDEQRQTALARIAARETLAEELGALMLSVDPRAAEEALRLVEHVPSPALVTPVEAAGRDLAARLERVNALTVEEDPGYEGAADVSIRFSGWMVAARKLRQECGGDFSPELERILVLARVREDSQVLRSDVLRVASYSMHQWTGLEPLPTDPKPR